MTIIAKYPGICAACGGTITPGETIEWAKGQKARHAACPRNRQSTGTPARTMPSEGGPWAGARGGVRHERGVNRRSGHCDRCGDRLAAGAGRLEYCVEDSGCPTHHDEGGYHLYCADSAECLARARTRRDAERAARAAVDAAEAELRAIIGLLSPLDAAPAWVTGCAPLARWAKPAMVHTGAYPVLYLSEAEAYYYVPGYFACDWDTPAKHAAVTVTPELQARILAAVAAAREAGLLKGGEA